MKDRLRANALPLSLLLLGLLLHLAGLGHPGEVVWDEYHFLRFAQGYLDGEFFFDIHPPLGKLLISGALGAAGAPSPLDFDFVGGSPFPAGYPYLAARLLPAIAGGLLPWLVYAVARALSLSRRGAFLAGAFVLLENAILAESRLAMIDIFLHVFIFAAFLAFLVHRQAAPWSARWWALLALAGLLAGAAVSVKWPGLGALAVLGVATLTEAAERKDWRIVPARAALLLAGAAAVYVATFAIHFRCLPKTGPGSVYLSPEFLATLEGSPESRRPEIPPLGAAGRFVQLNRKMYSINVDLPMTHPDGSRWPQWLAGRRWICFWNDAADPSKRIFLCGNPVVWAFGTGSLAAALWFLVARRAALRELMASDPAWRGKVAALEFLSAAWLVHLLPFAAISRTMFLYHYFTSYIAAILLGAFLLFEVAPAAGWRGPLRRAEADPRMVGVLLALAAAGFLYVAPVTYGFRTFDLHSALLPVVAPK